MDTLCERNKKQVLRLFENDLSAYDQVIAEDICIHGPATGQETHGIAAAKRVDAAYVHAYPNVNCVIQDILAIDDKVVVRWTWHGTHMGERKGLRLNGEILDIPPTHQEVVVNGTHIYRFNDQGKIVDSWAMWDRLGELEQIARVSIDVKTSKE